jgi:SPP1 family predicted phage head-tail adaptor
MRSGSLRQRLALSSATLVADGMGGWTVVLPWVLVATVWGQIAPLTGAERLQAAQMTSIVTHEITIRYRTGVVPQMRIARTAGSQTFEIHAVLRSDDFRRRQLTLLCSEVQTT